MAEHARVFNETRNFWMKRRQAENAIKDGSAAWVVEGAVIRSLTVQETYDVRAEQAARRAYLEIPLPYGELPGCRFALPESGREASQRGRRLMWEAHEFVRSMTGRAA